MSGISKNLKDHDTLRSATQLRTERDEESHDQLSARDEISPLTKSGSREAAIESSGSRPTCALDNRLLDVSLLPSSPKSFVELNQGQQLTKPGLSQIQFSIKQVAVSIQGIEERIDPPGISCTPGVFGLVTQ